MNHKLGLVAWLLMILLLAAGCLTQNSDYSLPCEERETLFCEDFEGVDPTLGGSQLVISTASDQWWVTRDDDQDYLFQDFPLGGRSQDNMIVLSGGLYKDQAKSFLYTREIDLGSATQATFGFNVIYKTEKHWDGLVVFAITDGIEGVKDPQKWIMLTPRGGYPDSVLLNGSLVPGFSGSSAGWTHEEIDLAPFLGGKLILGFYFTSDDYLNAWGVGLDDIIVNADAGQVASQMAGLTEHIIKEITPPKDPLISPELPRANPLQDTLCVMTDEEVVNESQRVIIKAISETDERILVLHPQTGSFCWIDQADIWIDGDSATLPKIVEKSRNTYFPVSLLGHTPIASDTACDSGSPNSLPIYLQTALVEEGKITTLFFKPMLPNEEKLTPEDPRVGEDAGYAELDLSRSPGGEIQVNVSGTIHSCLSDWNHPGDIVCQGLAENAAGPLNMEICWQGWDETQACPIGYYIDPFSAACVPVTGAADCSLACDEGYLFVDQIQSCQINMNDDSLGEDLDYCPPGTLVNSSAQRCIGTAYSLDTSCPPGFFYSLDAGACILLDEAENCPEGYQKLSDSEGCIPETPMAPPQCRTFELRFPVSEVTVKESTRCIKDPGNPNEIVSSLKAFDTVEILGVGEGGSWLVVINPDYQIPCWAPLDDFYLDKVDLNIQPVISAQKTD